MNRLLILFTFTILAFSVQGQCALEIQYDGAGNRIYHGNACDPDCSTHVINDLDAGVGSLRKAIACAKDGDDITFAPSLSGQYIDLSSGPIDVNVGVHINPTSNGNLALDIQVRSIQDHHLFTIFNNVDVTMSNFSMTSNEGFNDLVRILKNDGQLSLNFVDFYDDAAFKGSNATLLNNGTLIVDHFTDIHFVHYN